MYINNGDVDLEGFIDILVITNGRESYKYVIDSLKRQKNVSFNFVVFENMSWLNACNVCLKCSNSPYYMRLDDDMILHPYALHYFFNTVINNQSDNIVTYYYKLWESWNNRICGAVKIYNRKLTKNIGFEIDERGKVDKIFKKKAIERGYKYYSDKKNAVAIHAACSYDDNFKYSNLRKETNTKEFKIREKEIQYLDSVYRKTPLIKQLEMADIDLTEYNKKNNTKFYKFIEANNGN